MSGTTIELSEVEGIVAAALAANPGQVAAPPATNRPVRVDNLSFENVTCKVTVWADKVQRNGVPSTGKSIAFSMKDGKNFVDLNWEDLTEGHRMVFLNFLNNHVA